MKGRIFDEALLMICVVLFVVTLPRKDSPRPVRKARDLTYKAISPPRTYKRKPLTIKEQKEEVLHFISVGN